MPSRPLLTPGNFRSVEENGGAGPIALNYRHLSYFHAVAHEGNLTRAAQRLHVSQSAVSTQIRQLEERLGHALFERRGRELLLTEAGRIALEHADTIFTTGQELLAALGQGHAGRPILRVGALATLSRNFQIDFLRPLLEAGDAEIVLRSGHQNELLGQLAGHRLDVVLSNVQPDRDASTPWMAHLIDEQPVSLVCHPGRITGSDRRFETLAAREPLLLPTVETGLRSGIDALLDRHGIRPRIAAEVDDMAMLRLLARADAGVAILPPIVVKDELAGGTLVEAQRLETLTEPFYAVTVARQFPNPLLRRLLPTARGTEVADAGVPPA